MIKMPSELASLGTMDWISLMLPWVILHLYTVFGKHYGYRFKSVLSGMYRERMSWSKSIVQRENRIVDASIINGLMNVSVFFTSTTLLLMGAIVALMGNPDRIADLQAVVAELPGADRMHKDYQVLEVKTLLVLSFFMYAFFKFAWSVRQLNMAAMILGALPQYDPNNRNEAQETAFSTKFAEMSGLASENFNQGLRAYYFGFAAAIWIYSAIGACVAVLWVLVVLAQREYHSHTQRSIWGESTLLAQRYQPSEAVPFKAHQKAFDAPEEPKEEANRVEQPKAE